MLYGVLVCMHTFFLTKIWQKDCLLKAYSIMIPTKITDDKKQNFLKNFVKTLDNYAQWVYN